MAQRDIIQFAEGYIRKATFDDMSLRKSNINLQGLIPNDETATFE
jgi:hypothetical protein